VGCGGDGFLMEIYRDCVVASRSDFGGWWGRRWTSSRRESEYSLRVCRRSRVEFLTLRQTTTPITHPQPSSSSSLYDPPDTATGFASSNCGLLFAVVAASGIASMTAAASLFCSGSEAVTAIASRSAAACLCSALFVVEEILSVSRTGVADCVSCAHENATANANGHSWRRSLSWVEQFVPWGRRGLPLAAFSSPPHV